MIINNCRQTKRSKPVDKPVIPLRSIRLVKAAVLEQGQIEAAMSPKIDQIATEESIRQAFGASKRAIASTKRELRQAADAMLAEYRREETPARVASRRRH